MKKPTPAAPFGPAPRQQPNWDWRAACNFIGGGLGSGLIAWAALAPAEPGLRRWGLAIGALAVAAGLLAVWAEIGRPWRALNVFVHARRSWMSREALVAPLLLAAALAGAAFGAPAWLAWPAAAAALAFVGCQAMILRAARGIPAWREPRLAPLLLATAAAEGGGAWLVLMAFDSPAPPGYGGVFALLVTLRLALWSAWRRRLATAAAALAAIDAAGVVLFAATLLAAAAAVVVALSPLSDAGARALQALAGAAGIVGGVWFKLTLITRAAYTQGFALPHWPVRGVPRRGAGG